MAIGLTFENFYAVGSGAARNARVYGADWNEIPGGHSQKFSKISSLVISRARGADWNEIPDRHSQKFSKVSFTIILYCTLNREIFFFRLRNCYLWWSEPIHHVQSDEPIYHVQCSPYIIFNVILWECLPPNSWEFLMCVNICNWIWVNFCPQVWLNFCPRISENFCPWICVNFAFLETVHCIKKWHWMFV